MRRKHKTKKSCTRSEKRPITGKASVETEEVGQLLDELFYPELDGIDVIEFALDKENEVVKRRIDYRTGKAYCPNCGGEAIVVVKEIDKSYLDADEVDTNPKMLRHYTESILNDYCGSASCECGMHAGVIYGPTRQAVTDKIEKIWNTKIIDMSGNEGVQDASLVYPDYRDPIWKNMFLGIVKLIKGSMREDGLPSNLEFVLDFIRYCEAKVVCFWMEDMNSVEDMLKATAADTYDGDALDAGATWEDYDAWLDHSDTSEGFGGMEQFCDNVWSSISSEEIHEALRTA